MTKTEAYARAAIVSEALSWELTPYHHMARVKGVGVDCAQLPLAVYSATGHIPEVEVEYAHQWMIHRDEELYLQHVRKWSREIKKSQLLPGDFVIWKYGRTFSHGAIVIDYPVVIHALAKGRSVGVVRGNMETDLELIEREHKCFSVFGRK